MNRKVIWNTIQKRGNRFRRSCHLIEQSIASGLEAAIGRLDRMSDFEKAGASILMLFGAMLSDLLIGLHPAYRHVMYIPIWFSAWFMDRRFAAIIAMVASLWVWLAPYAASQVYGPAMTTGTVVAIFMFNFSAWIIGRLRHVYGREKLRARVDALTGCSNVLGFYESAEEYLKQIQHQYRPFALLYTDLDNFKRLNDTRGHVEADKALKLLGKLLMQCIRGDDLVARVGGDEFVVMLTGIGPDMAFAAAERLQRKIQNELHRRGYPVTLSVGCLAFNAAPESVHAALQMADQIMYSAKNSGKARVVQGVWPPQVETSADRTAVIYAN